jgi:hypothetical protein
LRLESCRRARFVTRRRKSDQAIRPGISFATFAGRAGMQVVSMRKQTHRPATRRACARPCIADRRQLLRPPSLASRTHVLFSLCHIVSSLYFLDGAALATGRHFLREAINLSNLPIDKFAVFHIRFNSLRGNYKHKKLHGRSLLPTCLWHLCGRSASNRALSAQDAPQGCGVPVTSAN